MAPAAGRCGEPKRASEGDSAEDDDDDEDDEDDDDEDDPAACVASSTECKSSEVGALTNDWTANSCGTNSSAC